MKKFSLIVLTVLMIFALLPVVKENNRTLLMMVLMRVEELKLRSLILIFQVRTKLLLKIRYLTVM